MSITGIDFLGKLLIILNKKATNEQQKSFDKIYSFYIISIIKQQKTKPNKDNNKGFLSQWILSMA